jgi:hypothetical protein
LVSQEQKRPSAAPSLMAGVALIVLGVAFILVQSVDFSFLETWWPLFVLVPGLLFFVMMLASGEKGGALAIPGSILTSIGGILLYQNFSGDWDAERKREVNRPRRSDPTAGPRDRRPSRPLRY